MRLFLCYARVDKPICIQIADKLSIHEVWYDQRLYVGQHWWREILHRLDWCEVFIYLLSPDSINSKYCRDEFRIARDSGRYIIPVLITPDDETPLPEELGEIHYADFSKGITPEAVATLLNAIHLIERDGVTVANGGLQLTVQDQFPPQRDVTEIIAEAAKALDDERYDHAIHLMERHKKDFEAWPMLPYDEILIEAKRRLDKQTREREAARLYRPIVELVQHKATRRFGFEAFKVFRKSYPDYDPENLVAYFTRHRPGNPPPIRRYTLPMLEWCPIPGSRSDQQQSLESGRFKISKYAITNEQFNEFIRASDGYSQTRWWDFSLEALKWREENPSPMPANTPSDHPRTNVNWYQAMAFCRWLSYKSGLTITLPTSRQWQRAASGDKRRLYPWGNKFHTNCANTKESGINSTTPVNAYPNGVSPYGVYGMAGTCWEWCLHAGPVDSNKREGDNVRAIHGGSYISSADRARIGFHYNLNPEYLFSSIGFRIVQLP